MTIELKKFGTMLISRPAGREAWLAAQAYVLPRDKKEEVIVDFSGVDVLGQMNFSQSSWNVSDKKA